MPAQAGTPPGDGDATESTPSARRRSALTVGAIYGGLYAYTSLAWYFGKAVSPSFQWRDEGWFGADTYAGGADKLGHMWGNYALVRGVSQVLRQGGWSAPGSMWASGALAMGFFSLSEIQDGYHGYGFSVNDMYANTAGVLLAGVMESSPTLDRSFSVRMQYFPSPAFLEHAREDGPFNSPEDYDGQTFLVSYHLAELPSVGSAPGLGWLRALDLTAGYEAVGFLPERTQPEQRLFLGLSLNVERIFYGSNAPARSVRRLVPKIYAPPLTVLRPLNTDPFEAGVPDGG